MKIIALYGPSGTGKSTSALLLAHQHKLEGLIDDGLLISKGKKMAGYSAKYEKTMTAAVKRAIFHYPPHAEEVRKTIEKENIQSLLILGTSKKMVQRIVQTLQLPKIEHYISIQDIRSPVEIKAALYQREMNGKHVIPLPQVEIEKDIVSKFVARVEKIFTKENKKIGEQTIVRPSFGIGKISVSEETLKKIALYSCHELQNVHIEHISISMDPLPMMSVDIKISTEMNSWKINIKQIAEYMQRFIYQSFLEHLNLELENIHVSIMGWEFKK